jgi:hypothetical protein
MESAARFQPFNATMKNIHPAGYPPPYYNPNFADVL